MIQVVFGSVRMPTPGRNYVWGSLLEGDIGVKPYKSKRP